MRSTKIHFFIFVLFCTQAFGQENPKPHPIENKIISLAQSHGITKDQIGLVITPIGKNEPAININGNKYFLPASTAKIITAWAALKKWGADHRFKTVIKQYKKSLCIEGGGDVSMVHERVFALVERTLSKLEKPSSIDHLYLDDSYFPPQRDYIQGFERDSQRAFTAPIGAVSLDFNSVTIHVTGSENGKAPMVTFIPDLDLFQLKNRASTQSKALFLDARIADKNSKWEIEIVGNIKPGETKTFYRSIFDPTLYFGSAFAKYFKMFSGHTIAQVQKSQCVPEATEIVTFYSKPLGEMIMDMNKFSNNVIAETLFAMLGEVPSSVEGSEYVQKMLAQVSLQDPNMVLENGSGLSRKTSVTPKWMTQLLGQIHQDLLSQPEIFASMGIAGMDGTLKRRTHHPDVVQKLRGKTGSLQGVTTLAGIVQTQAWGNCLFTLFFEHPKVPAWKIYDLEKQLLAIVTRDKI